MGNPIKVYYLFIALLYFGKGAYVTGYVPFLQSIGFSLAEVSLLNLCYWILVAVLELPTGLLADGRGRAWSIKMGAGATALGAMVYSQTSGFAGALMAETLWAIGTAFLSGAHQAWIADAVSPETNLRRIYATGKVVYYAAYLGGSMIGAVTAASSYRYMWLQTIIAQAAALAIVHVYMSGKGEPKERVTERVAFRAGIHALRSERALQWLATAMLIFGVTALTNHFWSPYFKSFVGQARLGLIWIVMPLFGLLGATFAARSRAAVGQEWYLIALSIGMVGTGFLIMGTPFGLWVALGGFAFLQIGFGMFVPATDSFLQHRVESSYRATFSSIQSLVGATGFGLASLAAGVALTGKENTPESIAWVWRLGGGMMVVGAVGLLIAQKYASKEENDAH